MKAPGDVLRWLRAVQAEPGLTLAERSVALALALRVNGQTGQCNPSKATLGGDSHTSETVAKRALVKLAALGLIAVESSNGRTSNRYRLTLNPATSGPVGDDQPGHQRPGSPSNPATSGPPTRPPAAPQPGHQRPTNRAKEQSKGTEKREQRAEGLPVAPDDPSNQAGSLLSLADCPSDWIEFAKTERPTLDPAGLWSKFKDHYAAATGDRARSRDWASTWRNWVRRERETRESAADARRRVLAEVEARAREGFHDENSVIDLAPASWRSAP